MTFPALKTRPAARKQVGNNARAAELHAANINPSHHHLRISLIPQAFFGTND